MNKKGFLSVEAVIVGAAVLVLGSLITMAIVSTSNKTLNGLGETTNNAVGQR